MTNRTAWPVLVALLLGSPAMAGGRQEPPDHSDWNPRRGASPVFGLGYQSPESVALSAGLIIGSVPGKGNKCIFGATSDGVLVQGTVGLRGPKASVGVARYNPAVGFGAKVSALHLWKSSGDVQAGSTLVGPEVEVSVTVVRLSMGYLWRVAGPKGSAGLLCWGVGVGF